MEVLSQPICPGTEENLGQNGRFSGCSSTLNLPHKRSATDSTTTCIQGHVCALEATYLINKLLSFLDPGCTSVISDCYTGWTKKDFVFDCPGYAKGTAIPLLPERLGSITNTANCRVPKQTGCIIIKSSVPAVSKVCSSVSQEIRDHFPGICVYISLMAALKFTYFYISINNVLLILIGVMFISYKRWNIYLETPCIHEESNNRFN